MPSMKASVFFWFRKEEIFNASFLPKKIHRKEDSQKKRNMVIRVEKAAVNSKTVIEYNEDKIREGTAEYMVPDPKHMIEEIKRLETNPFLIPNAGNLGVHVDADFLPEEGVNDNNIDEISVFILKELGLKGQPYIIYKHFDIDRVHYHIVSTRAMQNGHVIKLKQYKKMLKAVREYAKENGIQLVYSHILDIKDDEAIFVFNKKYAKGAQINYAVEIANKFNYGGENEFAAILKTMRIGVKVSERKKEECFLFTGLNSKGVSNTHLYSHLDPHGTILRAARSHKHTVNESDNKELCLTISDFIRESDNYQDFIKKMEQNQIFLLDLSSIKIGQAKKGEKKFVIVDRFLHNLVSVEELERVLGKVKYNLLIGDFFWPKKDQLLKEEAEIEREFSSDEPAGYRHKKGKITW